MVINLRITYTGGEFLSLQRIIVALNAFLQWDGFLDTKFDVRELSENELCHPQLETTDPDKGTYSV